MKKIFYNNITKKMFISLSLVVLLFGYVVPLKVEANNTLTESLNVYVKKLTGKEYAYQAWDAIEDDENLYNKLKNAFKNKSNRYQNMDFGKLFKMFTTCYEGGGLFNARKGRDYYFAGRINITYNKETLDISNIKVEVDDLVTACEWREIFQADLFQTQGWGAYPDKTYQKAIEKLKGTTYGSVETKIENGKIKLYINASNKQTLLTAFEACFGTGICGILADEGDPNNNAKQYSQYGVTVTYGRGENAPGDGNAPGDENGEEDTRTPLEKIKEYLLITIGVQESAVNTIVANVEELEEKRESTQQAPYDGTDYVDENGKYINILYVTVIWNDEELQDEITKIDIDLSYYIRDFLGEDAFKKIQYKQKEERKQEAEEDGDVGGMLLNPIFALVNFIVDSITGLFGEVMTGNGLSFNLAILSSSKVGGEPTAEEKAVAYPAEGVNVSSFGKKYKYPNIKYTPEEIFSGTIDLLSVDFISGKTAERNEDGTFKKDEDGNIIYSDNSSQDWLEIRKVIAAWYKALRMIAIIGLLSVLIYTGIKIIISANAKDKAKYKEWILNWFIAVAILFSMHYIMSFVNAVINEINVLLDEAGGEIVVKVVEGKEGKVTENEADTDYFKTNLMGYVRFMIQSEKGMVKVGFEVMYIALLVYTIKFTFVYLKRVLSMAFLTLIAPIVALTYPIDKLNDGSAQGFNMWIKEYIFNALLQPMHAVLYYILVGSSISIAAHNPIYGIVVLMFMTEAEKLLKKIFGFDKAKEGTVGGMAGAFAAGALASGVKNMARMSKLGGGNAGKGPDISPKKEDPLGGAKPTDKPGLDEAFGDNDGIDPSQTEQEETNSEEERDSQEERNPDEPEGPDLASERRVLEEFEAEGALSDDWSDEDYEAYQELERELEEKEEQQRLKEAAQAQAQEQPQPQEQSQAQPEPQPTTNTDPIHELADKNEQKREEKKERSRFAKGAGAVAKRLVKPIWDADKSRAQNWKRIGVGAAKGLAKGVGGFMLGTAAAAVQAGISITDGKYNPMEGIATFGAGFVGAGKLVDGVGRGLGNVAGVYRQGANAGNKEAMMERAQRTFADRDDVIAFNKKEYAGKEQEYMERERDNYLPTGVSDLKEMKSCMKYADKLVGKTEGMTDDQIKAAREKADRKAAATLDFKKRLADEGQTQAVTDKDKREKYIQEMVAQAERNGEDAAKTRRQYENAFKSVAAFNTANR